MERATIADELLLSAQPQEVKDAISRVYADAETLEEQYLQGKRDAFSEARTNIRSWLKNNFAVQSPLTPNQIDELCNYIDT